MRGGLLSSNKGFYNVGHGVFELSVELLLPVRVREIGVHVDALSVVYVWTTEIQNG